jgi:hypothetical protein
MVALYQGTTLEPALSVHGPAAHPWDEKFTTEARNHGEKSRKPNLRISVVNFFDRA